MQTFEIGLRDRKRMETRRRLEAAAVMLVSRDGLDKTTIDAIAAEADVSPRTFFNYFDSKEDAVLGIHDAVVTDDVLAAHIAAHAHEPLVESVIHLLFELLGTTVSDTEMRKSRMTILHAAPTLLGRQMMQMQRMGKQLLAAVTRIMTDENGAAPSRALVELTLSLCGAATRAAVHEWAESGSESAVDELPTRAIALVREAMDTLK